MSATLPRDPLMPRQPKGMGAGLGLAVLAHLLLILAIAFGVNWRASEPVGMDAELWAAVPQAAAPRAVAPEPQPPVQEVKPAPPPPPPAKAEEPPPKPAPDPQIAIEKAKREEAKKLEAKRLQDEQDKAKREKAKLEDQKREQAKQEAAKRQELEKQQAKKEEADRKKQEAAETARLAAARDQQLKRLQGMAGATGGDTSTGTALKSSGPSASYAGRIMAQIKPNILFTDTVDGNPTATVEVKLAPDGTIIGKRLLQSSGVKAWDEAVLRAIERTGILPRDVDGRVPPPFPIVFRLRDAT